MRDVGVLMCTHLNVQFCRRVKRRYRQRTAANAYGEATAATACCVSFVDRVVCCAALETLQVRFQLELL